jgi:hypothetical protein
MEIRYLNEEKLIEKFGPQLEKTFGITDRNKKKWMSVYIQNHLLNESQVFTFPQAGLLNTPGMGNVAAPAFGVGQSGFYNPSNTGSGDLFPSLLPIAVNIAAKTVGFDLVSVIPMQGPAGMLPYMEYVYANGKDPYGSYPRPNGGNPGINKYQDNPLVFKVPYGTWQDVLGAGKKLKVGDLYVFANGNPSVTASADYLAAIVKFVGYSRIDGDPIFEIVETLKIANSHPALSAPANPTLRNFDAINGISLADIWDLSGANDVYF